MFGIGDVGDSGACVFQAFTMTWLDYSVLLWVCCLTHSLYVNVVVRAASEGYEQRYKWISWGLPLGIAMIPLLASSYGPAGSWCWITNDAPGLRFALWYIPLFVAIIGLFLANGFLFKKVSDKTKQWEGTFSVRHSLSLTCMQTARIDSAALDAFTASVHSIRGRHLI